MEDLLRERLTALSWPYEAIAAFDLIEGKTLALDIDLPEIEDLPIKECAVAARGNKLNFKPLSDKRRRGLYLAHIHAIGFRLLGEVFSALPSIGTIIISAYSQRIDAATGHESDDYLYSATVSRKSYGKANFSSLEDLDPVIAFERFPLRRSMTKTGIIHPIEPFDPYNLNGEAA